MFASLKEKDPREKWRNKDRDPELPLQKMIDLSDVLKNVKSDLPNTRPRLRKQTYRSVLIMKKRNQEIAE